jgi:hypothetical protein
MATPLTGIRVSFRQSGGPRHPSAERVRLRSAAGTHAVASANQGIRASEHGRTEPINGGAPAAMTRRVTERKEISLLRSAPAAAPTDG